MRGWKVLRGPIRFYPLDMGQGCARIYIRFRRFAIAADEFMKVREIMLS